MEDIEIRRLSPNDLGAACKILGLAFADNPNTLVIARGDRARAQRMTESGARVAKLGRKYSYVLVAEAAAGRLVGVLNALQWPNCQLRMSEKLKAAPATIRVTGLGLPRALKMMNVWTRHDPGERHWHLGPIGVDPEFQGRGIGKAILASFLDMVDGQGAAAYLETDVDRNVALYEQFGFKVIDQEDISGVNNRFMWREAGARSGGSGGSWPALEQRAMRKCEQVFVRMPEDFPPKRIVRGIEQIQEQNAHILRQLQEQEHRPTGLAAGVWSDTRPNRVEAVAGGNVDPPAGCEEGRLMAWHLQGSMRKVLLVAGVTTGMAALVAWSLRVFGARSAWFAFVVVGLPLAWFALLGRVLALRRPVLRLPAQVHALRAFERDGRVYELLGVRVAKGLLRRGPLAAFGPQELRLPAEPTPASLAGLDAWMRQAETVHEILLVVTLGVVVNAAVRGWWDAAGWTLLFNLLGNGYPAMLQRYNRALLAQRFGRPRQLA